MKSRVLLVLAAAATGGGMLVGDAELVSRARKLATQARDPAPHYQHSEIGYNYRLSNVLAGIGRGQLRVLEDRVQARRRNFALAARNIPHIDVLPNAGLNVYDVLRSLLGILNRATMPQTAN